MEQQPAYESRNMAPADWPEVAQIYELGIESGLATFETRCPSYAQWDEAHQPECRLVILENGAVRGFCALSPCSSRPCYRGVAEVSVYVHPGSAGKGLGAQLLRRLIADSEDAGIWSLYAAVLSVNTPSLRLHSRCGFRTIGYRERLAMDRFGVWQDVTILERRAPE